MNTLATPSYRALMRRTVEIDFRYKHRHVRGSLSALSVMVPIFETMAGADVFILSKGHSCAALYACLEHFRKTSPNLSQVHPERQLSAGIEMTAGSLGHGLPFAVGIARARQLQNLPGIVYVLIGDGECSEGTTWESLLMANRFNLRNLVVHVDCNGFQGSDPRLDNGVACLPYLYSPIHFHETTPGMGCAYLEAKKEESVQLLTPTDYAAIMEELA